VARSIGSAPVAQAERALINGLQRANEGLMERPNRLIYKDFWCYEKRNKINTLNFNRQQVLAR
jgi:hypothetical protein